MRPIDVLILAAVLILVGIAVFFAVRRRKKGKCCGDCAQCAGCEDRRGDKSGRS